MYVRIVVELQIIQIEKKSIRYKIGMDFQIWALTTDVYDTKS